MSAQAEPDADKREFFKTIDWVDGKVRLLDQRALPDVEKYLDFDNVEDLIEAIKNMTTRGAPAIGCAAGYGALLLAREIEESLFADRSSFLRAFRQRLEPLGAARPTAVNLKWALERIFERASRVDPGATRDKILDEIEDEAISIHKEDQRANRALSEHGADLIEPGSRVLTYCNAGALATSGGYGTALGVIKAAWRRGLIEEALVCETRPLLQGARLTAWELERESIRYRLICDNMAGDLFARSMIERVIVGADRIASNGDVANKIGTYTIASLADRHKIPFYVAAPLSTIDFSIARGDQIEIEERDPNEIRSILGRLKIAPESAPTSSRAFDLTPAELIGAIITENGIARAPYTKSLESIRRR